MTHSFPPRRSSDLVAQICLFLLTEARYLPGKLLQTQPQRGAPQPVGTWSAIDLDLSRYDSIATLFAEASAESASRSEEHTSELQSLMRITYAVFCLKKKKQPANNSTKNQQP